MAKEKTEKKKSKSKPSLSMKTVKKLIDARIGDERIDAKVAALDERIDRIVAALSTAKPVKGL